MEIRLAFAPFLGRAVPAPLRTASPGASRSVFGAVICYPRRTLRATFNTSASTPAGVTGPPAPSPCTISGYSACCSVENATKASDPRRRDAGCCTSTATGPTRAMFPGGASESAESSRPATAAASAPESSSRSRRSESARTLRAGHHRRTPAQRFLRPGLASTGTRISPIHRRGVSSAHATDRLGSAVVRTVRSRPPCAPRTP